MNVNKAQSTNGYPPGAVPVAAVGNGSNAIATATIAAVAGKTAYVTGAQIFGFGATAAGAVTGGITGTLGGNVAFNVAVPAGVTNQITPVVLTFNPPLPASAVNTAIAASLPALGAGNVDARVNIQGFYL